MSPANFPDADRDQIHARAISWLAAGGGRSARRPASSDVRQFDVVDLRLFAPASCAPLAVSSRSDALPDVPLISDFVPGFEAYSWNGITAPKDCPAAIVDKLNAAVNAIVAESRVQEAARRGRQHADFRFTGRIWEIDHRGQRQMGQGRQFQPRSGR